MKPDKKSFMAGFDAGYALGQDHAGEGAGWLEAPDRYEAWKRLQTPKKTLPKKIKDSSIGDEDIPY